MTNEFLKRFNLDEDHMIMYVYGYYNNYSSLIQINIPFFRFITKHSCSHYFNFITWYAKKILLNSIFNLLKLHTYFDRLNYFKILEK